MTANFLRRKAPEPPAQSNSTPRTSRTCPPCIAYRLRLRRAAWASHGLVRGGRRRGPATIGDGGVSRVPLRKSEGSRTYLLETEILERPLERLSDLVSIQGTHQRLCKERPQTQGQPHRLAFLTPSRTQQQTDLGVNLKVKQADLPQRPLRPSRSVLLRDTVHASGVDPSVTVGCKGGDEGLLACERVVGVELGRADVARSLRERRASASGHRGGRFSESRRLTSRMSGTWRWDGMVVQEDGGNGRTG